MEETWVHDALLADVKDEPALGLTSADVLNAGRRSRRRRLAARVLGLTGGVAVLASVLLVPPGPPRDSAASRTAPPFMGWTELDPQPFCDAANVPASPNVIPTSMPDSKFGGQIPLPTEPTWHISARLSCYLMRAVPAKLPGFHFDLPFYGPEGTLPLQVYAQHPDEAMFGANAVVADRYGVGSVGFGVRPVSAAGTADEVKSCGRFCELRTGPRGETIMVLRGPADDVTGANTINVSVHFRNTMVVAAASNTDDRFPAPDDRPVATRGEPPLAVDQLIELATSPELTLFP